jgi:deazaflavin-dependent oxidoreductase (nitroreductase family)
MGTRIMQVKPTARAVLRTREDHMADYNEQIIDDFRANEGRVGGDFAGAPLLLLHSTGAKSGAERVNPTMYLADGNRYLVFASKGGAPTNPAWYHNLKANPRATIEVGTRTVQVEAVELEGAERARMYEKQAQLYPGFATYQENTDRLIPVLALTPVQ